MIYASSGRVPLTCFVCNGFPLFFSSHMLAVFDAKAPFLQLHTSVGAKTLVYLCGNTTPSTFTTLTERLSASALTFSFNLRRALTVGQSVFPSGLHHSNADEIWR